jgi:hypothetical protein
MLAVAGCSGASTSMQLIPSFPSLPSLPSLSKLLPSISSMECSTVSPKALKRVNWTRVPKVNMRIRNDEFEPMIVHMTQGWPYVFRIRNRDKESHSFNAERFLRSMAVIRLTVDGERQNETCISSIEIPGESMAELHLVAAIDGHYEFQDDWFPAATLMSGGADGVIIVEERLKAERD